MNWIDNNTAIGCDGTIYTFHRGGIVNIFGKNWKGKWLPDGTPKGPNATLSLKTKVRALTIVKLIDKMIKNEKS